MSYNPPHYRDENIWEPIPETEIERLQKTLYNHIRKINEDKIESEKITMSKSERKQFVEKLLKKQNNTCAFGKEVAGKYCWNESKDNFTKTKKREDSIYDEVRYIRLQWSHIKPRCRKESQSIDGLYLLCARCNNQLQTSRHLEQILKEFESKILHMRKFIQENDISCLECEKL